MGLMDFLGFGQDHGSYSPAAYDNKGATRLNQYASDPSQQWADTSAANPYLQQLLGPGGAYQDAAQQAKDIQGQGFSLTQGDRTAYGQASDDIARQFGQTEGSLANSLGSRGFGNAQSGTAGAMFSGLQGNKNEMLAKSQQGIAEARMQFAQKSLNDTRSFMSQAAGVGSSANQGQAGMLAQGANAYNTGWGTANNANYQAFQNKQENTNPSFGEMLGGNISQLMNPVAGARAAAGIVGAGGGMGAGAKPGSGTGGVDPGWSVSNMGAPNVGPQR